MILTADPWTDAEWAKERKRSRDWGCKIEPGRLLMLRIILPHDHADYKSAEQRRQFRWVLWDAVPISYAEARVNHECCELYGERGWGVVACRRGPKGGWTGAVFCRNKLHGQAMVRKSVNRGYYLAWVFDDCVPPVRKPPTELKSRTQFDVRRAHLALHA